MFKSGCSWSGQLSPTGFGTEYRPIHIDKYGGDAQPRIDGAGQIEDTLLLRNQEFWEARNLEITNSGTGGKVRRGIHIDADNYGDMRCLLENPT